MLLHFLVFCAEAGYIYVRRDTEKPYCTVATALPGESRVASFDGSGKCRKAPHRIGLNGSFCGIWFTILQNGGLQIDDSAQPFHSFFACSRTCFTDPALVSSGMQLPQVPAYPTLVHKQVLASLTRRAGLKNVPLTFGLPQAFHRLAVDSIASGGQKYYIFKPAAAARGEGIFISKNVSDFDGQDGVAQEYLQDLALLQRRKNDFRLYLLITSEDPLIVYLYEEGIVRFSQQLYEPASPENAKDLRMHLTNTAIRGNNTTAAKRLLSEVLDEMVDHAEDIFTADVAPRVTTASLWQKITQLFVDTLAATYPAFLDRSFQEPRAYDYPKQFFGLYGADVALKQNGEPVLFEMNLQPALPLDDDADKAVKPRMLREALQLVGIREVNHHFDPNDEATRRAYESIFPGSNLTVLEKRVLLQLVDENKRLGSWKRLELWEQIRSYGEWNRLVWQWHDRLDEAFRQKKEEL